MKFVIVFAVVMAAGLCARAAVSAPPDPVSEKSIVAPLQYQSPFRDYRRLGDDKLIPWKDANDEVGRIGGWRAYAKEATETTETPKPAATIMPQPAAAKPADAVPPKAVSGAHRHDQHN